MGKNLVFVPDCPSTNVLALQMGQQSPVKEGTLVITDHQTAGKGQRGNTWEAEPQKNLTFSLVLRPAFLAVNKQFFLNIVICLALKDYLKEKTPDSIYIKWPNDILVHEKKISGILIENQLQGNKISNSVIGIGLNINQRYFSSRSAISLSEVTGEVYDLDRELSAVLGHIERRYLQLRAGEYDLLMGLYLDHLYGRNEKRLYSGNGQTFEGVIEDLDDVGRLRVRVGREIQVFGVKEIQFHLS